MLLSFIIITHNRCEKLRRCLTSLLSQQAIGEHEVLVLDNGSSDGTAAMLSREFASIQCIISGDNLGVGGGRNRAAQQARGQWLVFIDDDAYFPHAQAALALEGYCRKAGADDAAFNMAILAPDGALFRAYLPRFDKTPPEDGAHCACLMSGACALRAEVFRELGGFWPLLNPYGFEDRDLIFRLLAAGYHARYARRAALVHDKAEDVQLNPRWAAYMMPHHSWVALRHLPRRYVLSYALHGWPYFAYKALRAKQGRALLRGFARFIRHLPEVLRLRRPLSPQMLAHCRRFSARLRY